MKDYKQFIRDHKDWMDGKREDKPIGKEYDLIKANFEKADLDGANFEGANLKWANLKWANLYSTNLKDADLYKANFCNANLKGADLDGANIKEATINLYLIDTIALTKPLFEIIKENNKWDLIKLAKELLEDEHEWKKRNI